jgi:hypothetical protein
MSAPLSSADDEPAAPDIDEAGIDRAQIRAMLDLSPEERLPRLRTTLEETKRRG